MNARNWIVAEVPRERCPILSTLIVPRSSCLGRAQLLQTLANGRKGVEYESVAQLTVTAGVTQTGAFVNCFQ